VGEVLKVDMTAVCAELVPSPTGYETKSSQEIRIIAMWLNDERSATAVVGERATEVEYELAIRASVVRLTTANLRI
jgi:hypothetical protein